MSNLPSQTTPLLASDENVAVRAGGDMLTLVPPWQTTAAAPDGFFDANLPWILNSTLVDFEAYGVQPNQVVLLTAPAPQFPGGGQLLAVDSVSGTQCTLRRLHQDLGVGQPPAPIVGLTGVKFIIPTLLPQIEEASFDIKTRFGVDETIFSRSSSYMFEIRELRTATVLTVLFQRYTSENRARQGDFADKVITIKAELQRALDRVQIRWGATGASQEPSSIFSTKICR